MLEVILVPLDGSALSERALPVAERLARAGGGKLVLVRAVVAHAAPGSDRAEEQVRVVDAAEEYLCSFQSRLQAAGLTVETAVPYASPTEGILEEIHIRKAGLVVMSTHGRSGLGRWVYGSVAERVLHESPVPVALVRAWHPGETRAETTGPRLLVPLDGSRYSECSLVVASETARALAAEIVLFQVVPPAHAVVGQSGQIVATVEQQLEVELAKAGGYLLSVRDRLLADSPNLSITTDVQVGNAADMISGLAMEYGCSMIVMSTHGRSAIARTLFGSVAGQVLRAGALPIVLVRPESALPSDSVLAHAAEIHPPPAPEGPIVSLSLAQNDVELLRSALRTYTLSKSRQAHIAGQVNRITQALDEAVDRATNQQPGG